MTSSMKGSQGAPSSSFSMPPQDDSRNERIVPVFEAEEDNEPRKARATKVDKRQGKHERTHGLGNKPLQSTMADAEGRGDAIRSPSPGSKQRSKDKRAGHLASIGRPSKPQQQRQAQQIPSPDHPLSDYRHKLAREMSARVDQTSPTSPLFPSSQSLAEGEHATASGSRPTIPNLSSDDSAKTTTSSGSNRTVIAPDTGNTSPAKTPSYPFPPMSTPTSAPSGFFSSGAQSSSARIAREEPIAASTALPTARDAGPRGHVQRPQSSTQRDESYSSLRSDQVQPSPSTPASAMAFLPSTANNARETGVPYTDGGRQSRFEAEGPDGLSTPNLYELTLALSSEPGLDEWWHSVVEIATQWYKAERVTLAVPSDTTDVENMPWGQKATFNAHEKDDQLSLGYMGRGSSLGTSTTDTAGDGTPLSDVLSSNPTPVPVLAPSDSSRRPALSSRYSFTTYEDNREQRAHEPSSTAQPAPMAATRPSWSRRYTSHPVSTQRSDVAKADIPLGMLPPKLYSNLNHDALREHDAVENPQDAIRMVDESLRPHSETQGRVLPILQALDYEADPLVDHNGVQRVLDRGHVVALTRSYPYVDLKKDVAPEKHVTTAEGITSPPTITRPRAASVKPHFYSNASVKAPSILGRSSSVTAKPTTRPSVTFMRKLTSSSVASKIEQASIPRPKSPLYEECEQLPPSPWAQSPVPSPAIRHDPSENPFFGDACVDEDTFNPPTAPHDYREARLSATIGVDNAWTVLHIPLYRPFLPKVSNHTFKLDKSKMERRASPKRKPPRTAAEELPRAARASPSRSRQMPIAILSILSPVIPYPSNLRYSLEHLAPHIATSFSLCQHYSNLEAEVKGLTRSRRGGLGGFGGMDTDDYLQSSTPSAFSKTPNQSSDDAALLRSAAGSLTSISDNSAHARSMTGSPSATQGWDFSTLSMLLEREGLANAENGPSPGLTSLAGEGYFGMRPSGHPATTPGSNSGGGGGGMQRGRKSSTTAGITPGEKRLSSLRSPELVPHSQLNTQTTGQSAIEMAAYVPSSLSTGLAAEDATTAAWKTPLGETVQESLPGAAEIGARSITTLKELSSMASVLSSDPKKRAIENETHAHDVGNYASKFGSPPDGDQPHPNDHSRSHGHGFGRGHGRGHSQLHSYGADFATTFPSLPRSGTIAVSGDGADLALGAFVPSQPPSLASPSPAIMPQPSDKLKGLILDSLPAHVFVAEPQTGAVVWVNSRYLAYRGKTVESLAEDPWGSIHPDDREEYLTAWRHSVRSGEQFSRTVQIRRFDGTYRWFQARAIASRDRRNTIVQFLGSYMDIHDQHIAELKAARQEEIEESEMKHRILANLIPQIIFTANEEEGITFANEQWLLYTGQSFKDLLGLGFLDFVHPDDLAKCCFLPVPAHLQERRKRILQAVMSQQAARGAAEIDVKFQRMAFQTSARRGSGGNGGDGEELSELAEMARRGIVMVTTDDNGRPSYTTEARLRSKTGDYRWHLIRCVETGTMDFGKGYNSYFGSATDINDHKLLETKLKEAMDSKTRFLSNMSHEIRTPLIGISGMVSFLQDTTLNEEQRDYTNTIQTSANSLLMIINDILDLSKVDAGMMKLSFEWFHTRSLIEEVNELVSTMAIAKGLELNYIVDAEVPAWIKGDRVRMRQVLLNVIGNAIKFTAEGEVFSRCRVVSQPVGAEAEEAEDQIVLEFSVTDTGRGFTREEAELIFKPFSQIDGSSTRQHGGSGLGLVISRQLVELHGGKMDGCAVPGKGSTFTFTARFGLPSEFDHPAGLATPSRETDTVSSVTLAAMGLSVSSAFVDHAAVIAAAAASAAGVSAAGMTGASLLLKPQSPAGSSGTSGTATTEATTETTDTATTVARTEESTAQRTKGIPSSTSLAGTVTNYAEGKPVFSILIVCPKTHSRDATKTHIETTLPKNVPYRITVVSTIADAQKLIGAEDVGAFTHVVVNLPSPHEILELVDQLDRSMMLGKTNFLILSDSVQRQAVSKLAANTRYEQLLAGAQVTYIYKPVKPSRFAVIFDPAEERDISIDHNRSTAQQLVKTQKQSYLDLEQRMGNRGYKVLLVEDNMVNQKVLKKYLHKVGVDVDVAADGVACTEMVLSRPHDYYSLILCDLHMPRKDGYQACQEIRAWERADGHTKPLPIIALSANVMSDVYDKCVEAGFDKYITKPVDFVVLSRALAEFF